MLVQVGDHIAQGLPFHTENEGCTILVCGANGELLVLLKKPPNSDSDEVYWVRSKGPGGRSTKTR